MTIRARSHRRLQPLARQRGIVVFVALIAVVLMSLAAVGLMRSVQTNTLVVGNIAFRQAAQAMAAAAVEKAVYDMFPPTALIADLKVDNLARNYFAAIQPGQDAMGVPAVLQGNLAAYPGAAQIIRDNPNPAVAITASYIIERMCDNDAIGKEATPNDCEMIPPKQSPGMETNLKNRIVLSRIPYYRMTVRVDGPGNSVAFSQAMLR